jgi:hypothetical protein
LAVGIVVLAVQIGAVRPRLTRRSDQVLAGLGAPRSRGHYVYVGLELIKVLALAAAGSFYYPIERLPSIPGRPKG